MKRTDLLSLETVNRPQKNRQRGIDANHPREGQHIVNTRQNHNRLADDNERSHHRILERVLDVLRPHLLDTDHALPARGIGVELWLLGFAIVVGLINEEDNGNQTQSCLNGVDAECPLPDLGVDDECCEERA